MNTMLEKRRSLVKNKKGFTLIELIVVIVIIGILAAVLIPRMTGFTDKAKGTEVLVHAKQFATAYDSLYAENSNDWSKIEFSNVTDLANIPSSTKQEEFNGDGSFKLKTDDGKIAGRTTSAGAVEILNK